MTLDMMVRKSVARWCHTVALESVGTTGHAERVLLAKSMAMGIAPPLTATDSPLPHVIFLAGVFITKSADEINETDTDAMVATIFADLITVRAWIT